LTAAGASGYAAFRYEFWNDGAVAAETMDGCRICGGLTRRASRLCAACDAQLDDYETLDSRTADLVIPVRRYGGAPSVAGAAVPPQATQVPQVPQVPPDTRRRLVLTLAGSGAALGGALALALLLAG
jgi:hypothetical protein